MAEAEVWDDDGEPDGEPEPDREPEPDGESDGEPEPDGEPDPDGAGDAGELLGSLLGSLLGLVVGAGDVEEVEELEGEGVGVGDFDGFGVDVGVGVGVGVGEDVLEAGSTWQVVSVLALALAEVLGLGEAAVSLSVPARAVPGKLASTPRVRKPPASTLGAAARTCARLIKSPCLRCSS
ncbi:MAG: hypothetical protein ACRDOH_03095, partial [Streptosporangiaceae bacterium]